MPKRRKTAPARPAPIQLALFAEAASLIRIRAERNEYRYYRLEPHPDPGAALNALARIAQAKRRRGYQDGAA